MQNGDSLTQQAKIQENIFKSFIVFMQSQEKPRQHEPCEPQFLEAEMWKYKQVTYSRTKKAQLNISRKICYQTDIKRFRWD